MSDDKITGLVQAILALTVLELAELNRRLQGRGPDPGGVREPRRPLRPLDARGIALDASEGKTDPMP